MEVNTTLQHGCSERSIPYLQESDNKIQIMLQISRTLCLAYFFIIRMPREVWHSLYGKRRGEKRMNRIKELLTRKSPGYYPTESILIVVAVFLLIILKEPIVAILESVLAKL